jgi:hypothetical protein
VKNIFCNNSGIYGIQKPIGMSELMAYANRTQSRESLHTRFGILCVKPFFDKVKMIYQYTRVFYFISQ